MSIIDPSLLSIPDDTEDYSGYSVADLIAELKGAWSNDLPALELEFCKRLEANVNRPLSDPELTESGVRVELHAAHIAPLLEVVRAEKSRCVVNWKQPLAHRADQFREIEFRLDKAEIALTKSKENRGS